MSSVAAGLFDDDDGDEWVTSGIKVDASVGLEEEAFSATDIKNIAEFRNKVAAFSDTNDLAKSYMDDSTLWRFFEAHCKERTRDVSFSHILTLLVHICQHFPFFCSCVLVLFWYPYFQGLRSSISRSSRRK